MPNLRTGGKILIDQLAIHGVEYVFSVPGESFLAALDALFDTPSIRFITCRHEGGAAMMAEAAGKLGGRPGVAFVTRGPGAANAMAGLHVAEQDETPMLLLVGLPPNGFEGRGAFQEFSLERMFASVVKWAAVVRDAGRIPEFVARAMHLSTSGRPGPVVLGLPEDVLEAVVDVSDAKPWRALDIAPPPDQLTALWGMLKDAEQPICIVGGPGWSRQAGADLETFASRFDLAVATAFRAQDYIDNRHPSFAGHLGIGIEGKLAAAVRSADLLVVIGAPLGEISTGGFTLLDPANPRQRLVHVRPSPDALNGLYQADLPIVATTAAFMRALASLDPPALRPWATLRRDLRLACEVWARPVGTTDGLGLARCIELASAKLAEQTIVTNGAGNYAAFLHRHFSYKGFRTQIAPASGSMGYGLPAAIAAKLLQPSRPVVAFAGDGCFLMTAMELATAVQYSLPVVVIVSNNGMYGTIRMHQERHYPQRVIGTSLVNPDFASLARSFGAHGERVTHLDEFEPALNRAFASGGPAVIELSVDPEAITPQQSISALRRANI